MWQWLQWCKNQRTKKVWGISLASALWSIGFYRNALVFERKRHRKEEVLYLLKLSALKWCQASNLLVRVSKELWIIYQEGATLITSTASNAVSFKKDFMGHSDGTFKNTRG